MAADLVAPGWTIHGLWPSSAASQVGGPAYCAADSSTATAPLLPAALVPTLGYWWPDLTPGRQLSAASGGNASEQPLWRHEWDKHGSCYDRSSGVPGAGGGGGSSSTTRYFVDALLAAARLNLSEALAAAGIVPSASEVYTVRQIRGAVAAILGDVLWAGPGQGLVCRQGAAHGALPRLSEVQLALDPDTLLPLQAAAARFQPASRPPGR